MALRRSSPLLTPPSRFICRGSPRITPLSDESRTRTRVTSRFKFHSVNLIHCLILAINGVTEKREDKKNDRMFLTLRVKYRFASSRYRIVFRCILKCLISAILHLFSLSLFFCFFFFPYLSRLPFNMDEIMIKEYFPKSIDIFAASCSIK